VGHFRAPIRRGLEIIATMRGRTSGYAVPTFVVDAPGGGGKIPLQPEWVSGFDQPELTLRNWRGEVFAYPTG
jgi:lysine 2,3-aminomutase